MKFSIHNNNVWQAVAGWKAQHDLSWSAVRSDALYLWTNAGPQGHYHLYRREDLSSWAFFFGVFAALILFDNFVLHRKNQKPTFRVACLYCLFWIACAGAFCGFIFFTRGPQAAFNWWTGYLLEWMLSVDNLFVFRTVFVVFKTPDEQKHKPLFWGIVGAVFFRMAFFVLEEVMIHNFVWMHFVLGAFLVYTGIKMIACEDDDDANPEENPILVKLFKVVPYIDAYAPEPKFFTSIPVDAQTMEPVLEANAAVTLQKTGKLPVELDGHVVVWQRRATRLMLVVACLELTDVIFAVDSVSAIVAQIPDLFLAYTACVFAMLGLRATFFVVDELVKLFSLLSYAVAAILMFIGAKLALKSWIEIPPSIVCIILISTLSLTMLASVVYEHVKGKEDENAEEDKGTKACA